MRCSSGSLPSLIAGERSPDGGGAVFLLNFPLLLGFLTMGSPLAAVHSRGHPFPRISDREQGKHL